MSEQSKRGLRHNKFKSLSPRKFIEGFILFVIGLSIIIIPFLFMDKIFVHALILVVMYVAFIFHLDHKFGYEARLKNVSTK